MAADVEDALLGELAEVVGRIAAEQARQELLVARCRAVGVRWADIAAVLGVSVQAAHKRYRHLRHDPATGQVWHEPTFPI